MGRNAEGRYEGLPFLGSVRVVDRRVRPDLLNVARPAYTSRAGVRFSVGGYLASPYPFYTVSPHNFQTFLMKALERDVMNAPIIRGSYWGEILLER